MEITNLAEANSILKTFIPRVKEVTGKDITLQRMMPLMKFLGNPEQKLRIIHVAGTSGKTSTAYYITAMLTAAGQKTGLTISPHIGSVTERIQVNMEPLSEQTFCKLLSEFLEIIKDFNPQPTYYELLIALAYWYFAKTDVEYAVVETGLGGLHDATNVAGRADKVCVITDIGLDHTKVLGKTIAEITAQKAGIIHGSNEAFCYIQSPVVMRVLREACVKQQASLHEIKPKPQQELTVNLPLFQRRNWYLAKEVYNFVASRYDLNQLSDTQLAETMRTSIPARMEKVEMKNKIIIMDGAHNPQKIKTLLASIRHQYPRDDIAVLAGFVRSRPVRLHNNLRQLIPATNHLIVTSFVPSQEMYTHSADPAKVAQYCNQIGYNNWEIERDNSKAVQKLLARPEPILLITGSFYLLQHLRPLLVKRQ